MPAAETSGWETCKIDCWHGDVKCDFYARGLMPAGDGEVSRSPPFWWWHRDPPPQEGRALAAYQALVERLLADGWVPAGPVARGTRSVSGGHSTGPARPPRRKLPHRSHPGPGEPNSMYHWETETESFLVLSGEALLIVEGQERPLRRWDFLHCPPKTEPVIVGAGDGPCVVLAMSSRENQAHGPYGAYTVDEVALRHGAGVEEETQDAEVAYARAPKSEPTRDRDGWLPST
jgi:uncharacterized cupin superfamily protein